MVTLTDIRLLDEGFADKLLVVDSGCWEWQGWIGAGGYGYVHRRKVRKYAAKVHRYMYWLVNGGDINGKYFICHTCDNPSCGNPAHLFKGTPKDNTRDMVAKGRAGKGPGLTLENHPRAKLTNKDVLVIRELCRRGAKPSQLAIEYGVSSNVIYGIRSGKFWSKVT